MLCDHQIISEHLLDYIEDSDSKSNKLSSAVRKQVEQSLSQCETCQATYRQAISLHQASHQWREQPVPEWHRTEYAVRPRQNSYSWLNWSAMATSSLAILMVVFQVQVTTSESGVNIAFGNTSNSQVEALIEKRINQYKEQQSLSLDARFIAENDKQMTANKLMVSDVLEKTRDERRDDLNFLITGIQTQRFEDQNKVEKRLAYLADNQIENNQYINQLIQTNSPVKGDK